MQIAFTAKLNSGSCCNGNIVGSSWSGALSTVGCSSAIGCSFSTGVKLKLNAWVSSFDTEFKAFRLDAKASSSLWAIPILFACSGSISAVNGISINLLCGSSTAGAEGVSKEIGGCSPAVSTGVERASGVEGSSGVPGIIFDGSGTLNTLTSGNMTNNLVRSEIDLFTTIVDLFDLNYTGVRLGVNALSNEHTFTYDPNTFTIITDDFIYYAKNDKYEIFSGHSIDKETIKKQVEKIKEYKLIVDIANRKSLLC